ncbi:sigma 54-interacting transcriptional regulator [Halalkalibacter krulwichiae]|uniref:HTH-type transcriptional regulatory protein TyrR n=1 Tax=Halalkalibacter krulwichiae TaxID=199441 RepID=A0A1X9MDJ1_9BACI|nr:sigma 54-interacting transcriptional regulator [Halalkalibacter krulwichiae]ARK30620.1 Transcriptional regulatory protein TyrR [Halalkalibacter krulwichiae]
MNGELPISFPLPIMITDERNIIIDFNQYVTGVQFPPIQKGKSINRLFDRLQPSGEFHIAFYNRYKYLIVSTKLDSYKQARFLHILLDGDHYVDLLDKIKELEMNRYNLSELNERNDELNEKLRQCQDLNALYKTQLEQIETKLSKDSEVVVKSEKMDGIFRLVERLANIDIPVLVQGEPGVGKDVLIRHLYRVSNRYETGKLIKVNCGEVPNELLEWELFGSELDMTSRAPGMIELADKGFLFLDKVEKLSLELQGKLLRVLGENKFQKGRESEERKIDVRVLVATQKDLKRMVEAGTFREDLYNWLRGVPVVVPPLRERKEDIFPLVHYYQTQINRKYELLKSFDESLKKFFYEHHWSGNVRELAHLLERLMLTTDSNELTVSDLPREYREEPQSTEQILREVEPLKDVVEHAERRVLMLAAQKYQTTYQIAKQLGTSQATVVRKMQKYDIKIK